MAGRRRSCGIRSFGIRSFGIRSFVVGLAVVGLAACSQAPDPPATEILETFEAGAERPEVLVALPVGPVTGESSRVVVGYTRDRYLIAGSSVEVLWVQRADAEGLVGLERHDANPVIFRDDRLDGWGWDHFDQRAEEWSLRNRLNAEIRPPAEFAPEPTLEPTPDSVPPTGAGGESSS